MVTIQLAVLRLVFGCLLLGGAKVTAFTQHQHVGRSVATQLRPFEIAHNDKRRERWRVVSFALKSLDGSTSSNSTSSDAKDNPEEDEGSLAENETPKVGSSSSSSSTPPGTKLRRLKDIMWVRECLEDLTAAEFACTVEAHDEEEESNRRFKRKRKRAVDYEKLLTKLNSRIRDLGCDNMEALDVHTADFQCVLEPGIGMGSLTYTDDQRSALLTRLVLTRTQLLKVIRGNATDAAESPDEPFLKLPELPRMELPKEASAADDVQGPKLYVRDDGTVDWDGALQDQAALRKFGTAVWQRINGRDWDGTEDESSDGSKSTKEKASPHAKSQVTAKVVDTPEIKRAREKLDRLSKELEQMEKDHYRLLNSAISQGSATANVKLATVEPKLRSKIQDSSDALDDVKVKVSFQTLIYELERIYTYLLGELGNPAVTGYIPLQDRLNVAEFGLLESQIDSFNRQFLDDESVDEDVLAVVFEQLTDFKRRLGIDYYVAGLSFDREAISPWLSELWIKTKKGLAFYVKGVRLFWNDIVFCLRLINRAAQGYTLKPREVRNIRYVMVEVKCHVFECTLIYTSFSQCIKFAFQSHF